MSKGLPGLYWLNAFGRPYADLIGRDKLRSSPAQEITEAGDAIIVQVYDEPSDWSEAESGGRHATVLTHIGPEYFFDRAVPERTTLAPDFGLQPLDPLPPRQAISPDGEHFTLMPGDHGQPPVSPSGPTT